MASPDGKAIAFLLRTLQYDVPASAATYIERGRPVSEASVLNLIDLDGAELTSFVDVRDYVWSVDGSQIAFTTGHYAGHDEPYTDTATWVADVARRTRTRLMTTGNQVAWPAFDRNIYVWTTPAIGGAWVTRVQMPEQRLEKTTFKCIDFSGSGQYYSCPDGFGPRGGLYRSADQSEVSTPAMASIMAYKALRWAPRGNLIWMRASLRSQPSGSFYSTDVLLDLDADTLTDVGRGIVGWAGEGRLLRQGEDGPEVVDVADVARPVK